MPALYVTGEFKACRLLGYKGSDKSEQVRSEPIMLQGNVSHINGQAFLLDRPQAQVPDWHIAISISLYDRHTSADPDSAHCAHNGLQS